VPETTCIDENSHTNTAINNRLKIEKIIAPPISDVPAHAMNMVIETIARARIRPLTRRLIPPVYMIGLWD